jgi:hypothetical protein
MTVERALMDEILEKGSDSVISESNLNDLMANSQEGRQIKRERMSPYAFNQDVAQELFGYEDTVFVPQNGEYEGEIASVPNTLRDLGGFVLVDYPSKQAAYLQDRNGEEGCKVVNFGDLQGVDQSLRRMAHRHLEITEDDPVIGEDVAYSSKGTGVNVETDNNYEHEVETGLEEVE